MSIEENFDDSTELLYATLKSDEDIPKETLDSLIAEAAGAQIRQLYNNRDDLKQQLEQETSE